MAIAIVPSYNGHNYESDPTIHNNTLAILSNQIRQYAVFTPDEERYFLEKLPIPKSNSDKASSENEIEEEDLIDSASGIISFGCTPIDRNELYLKKIRLSLLIDPNGYEDPKTVEDIIFRANLRLILPYSRKMSKIYPGMGEEDFIIIGAIGLMKSIQNFDIRKGTSFATHAIDWIKQSMVREAINCSTAIRLPVYMHTRIQKIREIERALEIEKGRNPSPQELREVLEKINVKDTKGRKPLGNLDCTLEIYYSPITKATLSLQKYLEAHEDGEEYDNTKRSIALLVENDMDDSLVEKEKIKRLLAGLKSLPKETLILVLLSRGIIDETHWTNEKLGYRFHCSRETIRKEINRALNYLQDYTND